MRKWINAKISFGMLLLAALLVVGLMPKWFAGHGPYDRDVFHGWDYKAPPFPISHLHWLGTDEDGHDLFSQIVYGIFPTLRDATLLVLIIMVTSFVIAILRKMYSIRIPVLDVVSDMMNVVPPVLIALLFLEAPWYYFSPQMAMWYCIVIGALEIARFVPTVEGDLKLLHEKPFIEAAVIAGCSKSRIFFKHLLPWLCPYLLEYVPLQYARVLTVMGELAYFGVYKNVTLHQTDTQILITTTQLDWPSLIGTDGNHWFTAPAAVLFPTVAFCLLIFTLRLLSAGLSQSMELDRPLHWAWSERQTLRSRVYSTRNPDSSRSRVSRNSGSPTTVK